MTVVGIAQTKPRRELFSPKLLKCYNFRAFEENGIIPLRGKPVFRGGKRPLKSPNAPTDLRAPLHITYLLFNVLSMERLLVVLSLLSPWNFASGKIHRISFETILKDDNRQFVHLLDFGFLIEGFLYVEIANFSLSTDRVDGDLIGFTLSKGDDVNGHLRGPSDCILRKTESIDEVIYLTYDFKNKFLLLDRVGSDIRNLQICAIDNTADLDSITTNNRCYQKSTTVNSVDKNGTTDFVEIEKSVHVEPLNRIPLSINDDGFSFKFLVNFVRKIDEGQYYFVYHNCHNYGINVKNRISASYKINYYFISTIGQQKAVWAVVFYIMHLLIVFCHLFESFRQYLKDDLDYRLKGLMLFGVIILIGTGWTFFKNFLTDRDRKLFMLVIPLQVLDNIALIIKEESEIGLESHSFGLKLFILIDLICCAAVILPVIWERSVSIRHLQEASRTDGKAAFNLKKLKLFRHFYIIIICYIYLTRIVNYLVISMMPFKYSYVVIMIVEVGSWVFYVITGYKFKPAINNPYFKLTQNDDDDDYEDVILQSGALENVMRVNKTSNSKSSAAGLKNREDSIELGDVIVHDQEMSHELD
uniref:Protein GPR107 n=1 Tax=Romanomermis culicivorax TaxID=13658 RepID=A0A915HMH2_ROMCU